MALNVPEGEPMEDVNVYFCFQCRAYSSVDIHDVYAHMADCSAQQKAENASSKECVFSQRFDAGGNEFTKIGHANRHTYEIIQIWISIASKMKQEGFNGVTWEMCDNKFKGLKRTYKKTKDNNEISRNATKNWEYYEVMDEILAKMPEVQPITSYDALLEKLCHSCCSRSMTSPQPSMSTEKLFRGRRKRKRDDDDAERRHRELLDRLDRFMLLMERLIDKL